MSSKPLTAIIVDDEPLAIEGLLLRLEKIDEIEVVGQAVDGDKAIELCQQLNPDVMFLDLNLPGLNGIEVVQSLQADTLPLIVFVSAYGEYALDAFELNAVDYVLKPVNLGRLQKAVDRILRRFERRESTDQKYRLLKALGDTMGIAVSELESWLQGSQPLPQKYDQQLVIKNENNDRVFLPTTEIKWIDAAGDYMCVHTKDKTHIVRITMKRLQKQLEPTTFVRIHKSTLVNIQHVKRVKPLRNSECMLEIDDDVQLKVSRNYSSQINDMIKKRLA